MKITFTHHAKYRLMERGISTENVRRIIKEPNSRKIDKYDMITARGMVQGKILEVIYKIQKNNYIIITAYYEN